MEIKTVLCLVLLAAAGTLYSGEQTVSSPDGNIKVTIDCGERLTYSVVYKETVCLLPSRLGMRFRFSPDLGYNVSVEKADLKSSDSAWRPVYGKHSQIADRFNELCLTLKEKQYPLRTFEVTFRVYNDGAAFRYGLLKSSDRGQELLLREETEFNFAENCTAWIGDDRNMGDDHEFIYRKGYLSDVKNCGAVNLPLLMKNDAGLYMLLTEAGLLNWPGMYAGGADNRTGAGEILTVRNPKLQGRESAAVIRPPQNSPWRVILLSEKAGAFIESETITNLNEPCRINDTSWIKPGLCAWDHWWSGNVNMNTEMLKEYIQLASDMGWPYQLLDWKWYGEYNRPDADVLTPAPEVDMEEVLRFAKERNVKCWVWLYWTDIDRQMEQAFALYKKWGIAGVKIDFMNRDDQEMVQWYEKTLKTAAKYNLMVNFHGAYKSTGIERTYPNLMTREGVMGNEYNKWTLMVTPDYNVTIPFTRMIAGPMDYTPGGFVNAVPEKFRNQTPAMVMTTRAHQLAQFVVYYSPVTTAADHPKNYMGQAGAEFLKKLPAAHDDIHVLAGEVGEYIAVVKRKGNTWYIGGMTGSDPRKLEIPFSFLPEGTFLAEIYQDGSDADTNPGNVNTRKENVTSESVITFPMARAGGFAVKITPSED